MTNYTDTDTITSLTENDRVTIRGITYVIERARTPEQMDEDKLHNIANVMRENGHRFQVALRRPKGRVLHIAIVFASGEISEPTRIG